MDEAEEIWHTTDGGALDSVRSNMSDLSDYAGVFSNDFANNEGDVSCSEDAKWLQTAGLGDDIEIGDDSDIVAAQVSNSEDTALLVHPFDCDWNNIMPEMDDVDKNSADEDETKDTDADIPTSKRSRKASVTVSVKSEEQPKQMPDKLLQEARKSTRARKTKETANAMEKKKKAPRRRKPKGEPKAKKKPGPADPMTTKRKREERLRRNRESANRSRIRKKQEMHTLKQDVVLLRQKVVTLSNRIEELEESNQGLRERLAMYKKPQNSYKPAVTVFALVFTVAFFAQPSTVPQVGLAQLPGQGASKVMSGLGRFGQGSKTFLLAPIIDMFSNSALDAALSTPGLTTVLGIVTKLFIAVVLASLCALCFHYFGSFRWSNKRQEKIHDASPDFVPDDDELILESV